MLASDVMDGASALLNDSTKELFTYNVQLPYLKIALEQITLELSALDVDTVKEVSAILLIPAGMEALTISSTPALPADLRTPKKLEERSTYGSGRSGGSFSPMVLGELPSIPQGYELGYWDYRENEIKFIGATQDVEIQIYYDKELAVIISENSVILDNRLKNPLTYYTAALCSRYIGENYQRYNDLMREFRVPMDNYIAITIGQNQALPVRRPGFRERRY